VATSRAKLGPGNWLGACLETCNGDVVVTLRPEGGTPALDTGDEIVPSKRALPPHDDSPCKEVSEEGARAGPVGGKGNIETGGAVFGSGADVG
jgi:hypothetical protein